MVNHKLGRVKISHTWWSLSPGSSAQITVWNCHGNAGQANIWDLYLSHFTDLVLYVKSVANTVPLLLNQALPHIPRLIIFHPLNSGNSINLLVPLISLSLLWRLDFFCENKIYWATSQTYWKLQGAGSHHSRTHWFILHCTSDTCYRYSYTIGVPVLAMANVDIVEATLKWSLFSKQSVCLASRTNNGFVSSGGMGNSPTVTKHDRKLGANASFGFQTQYCIWQATPDCST